MAGLYVANASALQPLVETLDLSESRLERLFERAGLPASIALRPTGLVPLHSAEVLLDVAHRMVGDEDFLFRCFDKEDARPYGIVAGTPLQEISAGANGAHVLASSLDGIITGDHFVTRIERDRIWLLRSTSATEFTRSWDVLQYNLRAIWSGMNRLGDGALLPVAVRLPASCRPCLLPEQLRHLPVQRTGNAVGLGYNLRDVAIRSSNKPLDLPDGSGHFTLSETTPREISGCLLNLVGSTDAHRLAKRTAKAFGISLRTYQRRLAEMGTTHAEILENARLSIALQRLRNTDDRITDIALDLGYPFPGHFTRFFKNKTGVSPSDYQRMVLQ